MSGFPFPVIRVAGVPPSLERIGVSASIRMVDDAQYQNRLRSFDFDMIIDQWGESLSPGNEQRDFWTSKAADTPGSRNTIGIHNPVVDELVDSLIASPDSNCWLSTRIVFGR